MVGSFRLSVIASTICLAFSSPATASGVRIVERSGQSNFADIGSAVSAASEGDVLLVGAGTYPGFNIAGKSVSIFAIGTVTIHGPVLVTGLSTDQVVVLEGLQLHGYNQTEPALRIMNCAGDVRVERCTLEGAGLIWWVFCNDDWLTGAPGAWIYNSGRVLVSNSQVVGGHGAGLDDQSDCCDLTYYGRGGDGIEATNSGLVLYDCSLQGGDGGDTECSPGAGGNGLALTDSRAFASGISMGGGNGGSSLQWPPGSGTPGPGGPGVRFSGQSRLTTVGCTMVGGLPGAPPSFGGTPFSFPSPARSADFVPSVGGDQGSWSLAFQGADADEVWAFASSKPDFRLSLSLRGAWLLRREFLEWTHLAGIAGPGGSLTAAIPRPDLAPGPLDPIHRVYFSQVVVRSTALQLIPQHFTPAFDRLGSPATLLLIDRASTPDCDGNGVNDFVQVIENPAQDANHNLIPDGCPGG